MFRPGVTPPRERDETALWMLVQRDRVLLREDGDGLAGSGELARLAPAGAAHYLGTLDGRQLWAAGVDEGAEADEGWRFSDLFSYHALAGDERWLAAGRAVQIVEWERTHRFCGRCGAPTAPVSGERAMRCRRCGLLAFPRLSPAVIALIHRGDEVLLARGHRFPAGMYSALAGFVEPGETVEGALAREVEEEVGVRVGALEYRGSQPWPFPNSLMLGFFAEYAGGEIALEEAEIAEAAWFRVDALPAIPGPISIANRLITAWAARRGAG